MKEQYVYHVNNSSVGNTEPVSLPNKTFSPKEKNCNKEL